MTSNLHSGKMKNSIIVLLLVIVASIGHAQQQTQSSFNYINPYNINKSYAGLDTCTEVYFQHKNQWVGVDKAPTNTFLQAHTRLPKKLGIGVGLNRWSAGLLSEIDFAVAISRHFEINSDLTISPSINLGYARYTFSAGNAVVFDNDVYLNQNQTSSGSFYGDLGVLAVYKQLEAGISVPRLVTTKPQFDVRNIDPSMKVENYLKLHASYDFRFKDVWGVKPMLVYRTIPQNGDMLDILAAATYNNQIGVALGYRTNSGIIASANYNINDMFTIGYGYDVAEEQVANLGTGSHEVLVGYKFCKAPAEEPLPEEKHYFLNGKVSAASGKQLTDASVVLKSIETGVASPVQLDSAGNFKVEVMPGKTYQLNAEHTDFVSTEAEVSIDSMLTESVQNVIMEHKENKVNGKVMNAKDNTPLANVTVKLANGETIVTDANGAFQFIANKQTLSSPLKEEVELSKEEFNTVTTAYTIAPGNYDPLSLAIAMQPIIKKDAPKIVDNKIIVNPIYFDVNSSKISDQAAVELNKIIEVMNENPQLVIEVNSHTDCTGSASGNQRLSDLRAKSCVSFIKAKITDPERISGKGLGESTPLTDCECNQCSKEEHAQNRRTEFIIIKK